jgi:hypothetical protein
MGTVLHGRTLCGREGNVKIDMQERRVNLTAQRHSAGEVSDGLFDVPHDQIVLQTKDIVLIEIGVIVGNYFGDEGVEAVRLDDVMQVRRVPWVTAANPQDHASGQQDCPAKVTFHVAADG